MQAVDELTITQAAMYLRRIPDRLYEASEATLLLAYDFEAFKRSWAKKPPKMPKWWDFVPRGLRPYWAERELLQAKAPPYTSELVASWSLAVQLGVGSNYAFSRLESDRLRASGWGRPNKAEPAILYSLEQTAKGKPAFMALGLEPADGGVRFERLNVDLPLPPGSQPAVIHDGSTEHRVAVYWLGSEEKPIQPGLYESGVLHLVSGLEGDDADEPALPVTDEQVLHEGPVGFTEGHEDVPIINRVLISHLVTGGFKTQD